MRGGTGSVIKKTETTTRGRGETAFFLAALVLYGVGLVWAVRETGWEEVRWSRYPVFLPTGLLALAAVNRWLRSKFLAWSLFTLSFVFLVAVFGACVLRMRSGPDASGWVFWRALAMYGALVMTALHQLRSEKIG